MKLRAFRWYVHARFSWWIGQCGWRPSWSSPWTLAYPPAVLILADPPASFFQRNLRVVRDAPQLRRLVSGFACPEIGGYSQKRVFTFVACVLSYVRTQQIRAGSFYHNKFKLGLCALPLLLLRPRLRYAYPRLVHPTRQVAFGGPQT